MRGRRDDLAQAVVLLRHAVKTNARVVLRATEAKALLAQLEVGPGPEGVFTRRAGEEE